MKIGSGLDYSLHQKLILIFAFQTIEGQTVKFVGYTEKTATSKHTIGFSLSSSLLKTNTTENKDTFMLKLIHYSYRTISHIEKIPLISQQ